MQWIRTGAALAALGVAAGAFGAHGLKDQVGPDLLDVWKTGAFYHIVHALALVVFGTLCTLHKPTPPKAVGWLFAIGILLFSGSLYLLVLTKVRALGAITPLGGLSFIAAWTWLAISIRE
ncbi:MAG: DUF423 domain-containing protein [Myxococcota bacterium]|nr:DUF423 domain-containing protein [Myxococcota bacterium]